MSMVQVRSFRFLSVILVPAVFALVQGVSTASANEVITLRSGNAPAGGPDPLIHMLVGVGGAPLSAAAFTPADFDAACNGPNAIVIGFPHSAWSPQLSCDPLAQWIGTDTFATPASAMFCQPFDVQTCCIHQATLSFCWTVDDVLGDALAGGPNPAGVYLNGVAVNPSIDGGNYAADTSVLVDVTGLVHCGSNQLQVYNRDLGFAVSGVMYSATIDIQECVTSTEFSSWGAVKSLYR